MNKVEKQLRMIPDFHTLTHSHVSRHTQYEIKYWPKTTWVGKEFTWLTGPSSRKTKAGIWRERQKHRPWRNTTNWLALIASPACFLIQPRPIYARMAPPTMIENKENTPTDMPMDQSIGGNSSTEFPSSQMYLGLCQLDKNYHSSLFSFFDSTYMSLLLLSRPVRLTMLNLW